MSPARRPQPSGLRIQPVRRTPAGMTRANSNAGRRSAPPPGTQQAPAVALGEALLGGPHRQHAVQLAVFQPALQLSAPAAGDLRRQSGNCWLSADSAAGRAISLRLCGTPRRSARALAFRIQQAVEFFVSRLMLRHCSYTRCPAAVRVSGRVWRSNSVTFSSCSRRCRRRVMADWVIPRYSAA